MGSNFDSFTYKTSCVTPNHATFIDIGFIPSRTQSANAISEFKKINQSSIEGLTVQI